MKSYTTKAELRQFGEEILTEARVNLRKAAKDRSPINATFLSHSSKDEDLVAGTIRILTNHGALVYTDKIDPTMPPYTTKETASKLKTRISQSKKFVLLATANSKDSKWVPWELGIADGYKGLNHIALFPAVEERNDTSWTSWEYMGLYLRIIWGEIEGYPKPMWIVLDESENTATPLGKWLSK